MSERDDIVVLGGDVEGLIAACTLADKGRLVRVVEPAPELGGAYRTDQLAPGFAAPLALCGIESFHPSLSRQLGLEKLGLRLLPPRGGVFLPPQGGGGLLLTPSGWRETLRRQAPAEVEPLDWLLGFLRRITRALQPLWTRPLPPPRPSGIGDAVDLLRIGWQLRSLGKAELPELLRLLPMPVRDVLDERLTDERLRAILAARALSHAWLAPRSAGSAYGLLAHCPAWASQPFAPPSVPQGGPAELIAALARAAEARGVEIDCGAEVDGILLQGGRAAGVVLADGRTVEASAVLSTFDPRRTLLDWIGPRQLEPSVVRGLRNLRGRAAAAFVRFAVDRLPAFSEAPAGEEHLHGRIQIGDHLDHLERAFDAAKYGALPRSPWLEITIPSLSQPGLAPDGKHVLVARAQTCPYELTGSTWEAERDALANRVTAQIEAVAPGFSSSVHHRDVLAPADLEQRLGISGGCLSQVDLSLDQLLYLRPLAGWYDHRTPLEGLYLGGAGTHPGIVGSGLQGRNAALSLLDDWRQGRLALAFR